MQDNALKKAKEINDQYVELKNKIEAISIKNHKMEEDNERIKQTQVRIIKDLALENVRIEEKKQQRENLINASGNSKSIINQDLITSSCKDSIDYFIGKSMYSETFCVFFNIQSDSIIINKKLTDPLMTFEGIKKEVAQQFNKPFEEIYFADESGNIMLNNMIVKNTLFPLENLSMKGYVPLIRLIDPNIEKEDNLENIIEEAKNKQEEESDKHLPLSEIIKDWFAHHLYHLIHIIILIIYILLFIFSTAGIRNSGTYSMINSSFSPYVNNYFSQPVDVSYHIYKYIN